MKQLKRGNEAPTFGDLSNLLGELSKQQPVCIIVDALDECPSAIRGRLVKVLQLTSSEDHKLSLLITSRLLDEFHSLLEDFERVNIEANARDIDLFIDHQFKINAHLKIFGKQDPKLQDDVKVNVRSKCNGM